MVIEGKFSCLGRIDICLVGILRGLVRIFNGATFKRDAVDP